jgi:hypothetical protein
MKHKISLLLFLAFSTLTISTFASTNVPASISTDTQWDASGSPYLIQGKVVVAKGATLHIGPSVQIVFQGPSAMEVDGTLDVEGSAAAPAVFRMTEGGLQSELFINGGTADMTNVRVLSGVFLVQDSQLHLQWFEITKGSGLYLRGATTASVENGKIYGNATGVVLDGQVKAVLEFNTITENTYGLYLKNFADLDCTNNSIHDNDKEVINNTPSAQLGENYWGNSDEKTVQAKIQGTVSLAPLKTLKDVLRIYIRTQLPLITKQMETALKTQERKEKQEALARQNPPKQPAAPATTTEAPTAEASAPAAPQATPESAEAALEAVEATEPESPAGTMTAKVESLPAAPHTLKPMDNLPPDQGDLSEVAGVAPSASAESTSTVSPSNPPVATESSAPAPASPLVPEPPPVADSTAPPVPPAVDASAPPSLPTSDVTLPPPQVEGNTTSSTVPVPPPATADSTNLPPVPPAGDVIAPPDIETSTAPTSTAGQNAPPAPSVPAPPDLTEQIPPAPAVSSTANTTTPNPPAATNNTVPAPPVPPAPASSTDSSLAPPPPAVAAQTAPVTPQPTPVPTASAADQQKAVQSLDGVGGDIDGMQAPPLDLGPDLSSPATANGSTNSPATGAPTPSSPSSDSSLALPPLKDADVAPPKDLDLPPTDDLGNGGQH